MTPRESMYWKGNLEVMGEPQIANALIVEATKHNVGTQEFQANTQEFDEKESLNISNASSALTRGALALNINIPHAFTFSILLRFQVR